MIRASLARRACRTIDLFCLAVALLLATGAGYADDLAAARPAAAAALLAWLLAVIGAGSSLPGRSRRAFSGRPWFELPAAMLAPSCHNANLDCHRHDAMFPTAGEWPHLMAARCYHHELGGFVVQCDGCAEQHVRALWLTSYYLVVGRGRQRWVVWQDQQSPAAWRRACVHARWMGEKLTEN